jgi:hypothetical protein
MLKVGILLLLLTMHMRKDSIQLHQVLNLMQKDIILKQLKAVVILKDLIQLQTEDHPMPKVKIMETIVEYMKM